MKLTTKIYRDVDLQSMWDLQEELRAQILAGKSDGEVWLVEHIPTLSLGRAEKGENILQAREFIQDQGLDIVEINRGGAITYHGPGQIVAYPVIDLKKFGLGIRNYVCKLEQTMIDTLKTWSIEAGRKKSAPGVYIDNRKIGSVGIHVRKQVSIHGLALNVCPNLEHFSFIRPCGLTDIEMTSVRKEGRDVSLEESFKVFASTFQKVFDCNLHQ